MILGMESRFGFAPGRESMSLLISFTSGIPDCRCHMSMEERIFTGTFGVDRRQGVLLLGSQTHVLHPKGVEHIPQHRLFFRREITRSLVFQDREQVDNVFRLR